MTYRVPPEPSPTPPAWGGRTRVKTAGYGLKHESFDPEVWPRLAAGRTAFQNDDLDTAERTALTVLRSLSRRHVSTPPTHEILAAVGSAYTLLGSVRRERGDVKGARESFEQAVTAFDEGGAAIGRGVVTFAQGIALLGAGQPVAAEKTLRRASEQGEDTPDLRRALAESLLQQNRRDEAYSLLHDDALPRAAHDWRAWALLATVADDLHKDPRQRVELWTNAADSLENAGRFDEAFNAVSRADSIESSPLTRLRLALTQARAGRASEALETLENSEMLAGRPEALILAAEILVNLDRTDEALAAALAAAEADPNLLERCAGVLATAARYDELLKVGTELDMLHNPAGALYQGLALLRLSRAADALEVLDRALDEWGPSSGLHRLLGQALIATGDGKEAFEHLGAAVALDPTDLWSKVSRASLWSQLGSRARALSELTQLVDDNPDYPPARAYLGDLLCQSEMYDEAVEHLQRAVVLDEPWIWVSLGIAATATGDLAQARSAYNRAIDADANSVEAQALLADLLLAEEDPASKVRGYELLQTVLTMAPDDPLVNALAGETLRRDRDFTGAVAYFDRALDAAPDHLYARVHRGQALLEEGVRTDEAVDNLKEAHRIAPQTLWVSYSLAEGYLKVGDDERADAVLKDVARQDKGSARALVMRAAIREKAGYPERAERLLREALRREPGHQEARKRLGFLMYSTGRYTEALKLADDSLADDGTDDDARYLRALALSASHIYGAAQEELETLVKHPGWPGTAALQLGEIHFLQGHYDEALRWLDTAISGQAAQAEALALRGAVRRAKGQLKEAEPDLREALRHDPGHAVAASELAGLLLSWGRTDEAIEVYGGAVLQDPQDTELLIGYADALRTAGRLGDAIAALDQILWVDPDHQAALRAQGWILIESKRNDEALASFRRAVELAGGSAAEAEVDLADALLYVGKVDEAWAAALHAARGAPDDPAVWTVLSGIAAESGAWDEAAVAARRATRCRVQVSDSYRSLGWALEHFDPPKGAEALAAHTEALRLEDGDLWARKGRANTLFMLGQVEEASKEYGAVWALLSKQTTLAWQSSALAGWCLFRLNRYQDAARSLQLALLYAHQTSQTLFDLALVALAEGNPSQALLYASRGFQDLSLIVPKLRHGALLVALHDLDTSIAVISADMEASRAAFRRSLCEHLEELSASENVRVKPLLFPGEPWWDEQLENTTS